MIASGLSQRERRDIYTNKWAEGNAYYITRRAQWLWGFLTAPVMPWLICPWLQPWQPDDYVHALTLKHTDRAKHGSYTACARTHTHTHTLTLTLTLTLTHAHGSFVCHRNFHFHSDDVARRSIFVLRDERQCRTEEMWSLFLTVMLTVVFPVFTEFSPVHGRPAAPALRCHGKQPQ